MRAFQISSTHMTHVYCWQITCRPGEVEEGQMRQILCSMMRWPYWVYLNSQDKGLLPIKELRGSHSQPQKSLVSH